MDIENGFTYIDQNNVNSEGFFKYNTCSSNFGVFQQNKKIELGIATTHDYIADNDTNYSEHSKTVEDGVPSQMLLVQDEDENKAFISLIVEDGESEIIFSQDKFTGLPGGSALKDVNSKSSNFSVNESNQGEFFKLTNDLVITLDSVQTDRMFKIEFKSQGNHNIVFEDSSGSSILDQYGFGQITNKGFVTQLWDGSEWSIDGGLDLIEP